MPKKSESESSKTVTGFLTQYVEGLTFLRQNKAVLVTACHKAMIALLAGSTFEIVLVAISEEVFTIGVGGGISLGLMFMMTGLGSGIGPIIARRLTRDNIKAIRAAIVFGYLIIAIGYLVVMPLFNFGTTLTGILIRGLGGGVVWTFSTQLLLQQLPINIGGRVFATEFALFTLSGAIGALLVGQALDIASISNILFSLAILILMPGILWFIWIRRQNRLATL